MIKAIQGSNITPVIKQKIEKSLPKFVESSTKKVTDGDILLFRQYIFSKDFELKTTQKEIKELFQIEDENDFFNASFEFLFKKLGVPECLKPQVLEIPMAETFKMAYGFAENILIKNPNAPKTTKIETYSLIRHELQHMLQNFAIYRHKDLGPKAITYYATSLANAQYAFIDNNARNTPMEQLITMGFPPEGLETYKNLKELLKSNNEEEYLKSLEGIRAGLFDMHIENLSSFRANIIKEMGELQEGSRAERRAEKFYNDMLKLNINVNTPDYHAGQYNYDRRENEAFTAQDVAYREAERHLTGKNDCYIHHIKLYNEKAIKELNNDEKASKEMIETATKLNETERIFNSPKEYADYLFD